MVKCKLVNLMKENEKLKLCLGDGSMKSDYRDSYGEIYVRIKNIIEKYNERCLSEGLPKGSRGLFSSGNLHMQSIAIGDYVVNKDIVSMKNRFYNSAKAKELLLKFFDAMKDARPTSRVSMITYDSLQN